MIGGWSRSGSTGEHATSTGARRRSAGSRGSSCSGWWSSSRVGTLTARLFYLQIANGTEYAAISTPPAHRRSSRSRRRAGSSTTATAAARHERPDVRGQGPPGRPARTRMRDEVVARLAALLAMDPSEINAHDRRQSRVRRSTSSASPRTSTRRPPSSSRRPATSCPGVEVAVEARRQYTDGPLMSQLLGYTGPVSAEQLPDLREEGYQPDDLLGQGRPRGAVRDGAARHVRRPRRVERDATGRRTQVLQTVQDAEPGASLTLTIDTQGPEERREGPQVGDGEDRHDARRRHRDEPADRRDPGDGQPADLRQQPVRPRHQRRPSTRSCSRTRTSRCSTTPSRRTTPRDRPTSS